MGQSIFQTMMPQQSQPQPQPQSQPQSQSGQRIAFANPMQKAQFIMNALSNPAAFAKEQFPDIPDEISNNPGAILNYLQKTRGIPPNQIQQLNNQNPYRGG